MAYLKFKACRRLGASAWHNKKLSPKQNTIIKLVIKKNTSRKQSDFSKKLQQLKKLAYFYGMRSLNPGTRAYPGREAALPGLDKKKSLLLSLETRLDVILVRLYFCSTLFAARQLITHNKIRVNLNLVNLPGFTVRKGDIISISAEASISKPRSAGLTSAKRLLNSPTRDVKPGTETVLGPPFARASLRSGLASLGCESSGLRGILRFVSRERPKIKGPNPGSRDGSGTKEGRPLGGSRCYPVNGAFVAIRERPFTGLGGLYHFEVNYKTFYAVLLYEPIQIHFPYKIDLDLLF